VCCLGGFGRKADNRKAVEVLTNLSRQGHPHAEFELAQCYLNGWGVSVDQVQAQALFTLSASKGHPLSQRFVENQGLKAD